MTRTLFPEAPSSSRCQTAQSDRAGFHASLRSTDTFLCSYPKSGTTWLGYLVAQVLKQDEAEALDLKSFNKYVPDVNLLYSKRGTLAEHGKLASPRTFLCHAAYDANLPRVVYVTRDPRDVMVSYWHYRKFLSPTFSLSLVDFLRSGDHWPCEWDEHVASWLLPRRHPNLLVIRYEDMHKDAAGVLQSVLDFSGIEHTPARIELAVESSRFEKMRAAEETFGVHGKKGDPRERFVRKGRVGNWQEEMGYAELRTIEEKYGKTMRLAGYAPLS